MSIAVLNKNKTIVYENYVVVNIGRFNLKLGVQLNGRCNINKLLQTLNNKTKSRFHKC